jgi:large subunit ribosomal protein L20
MPRVKRGEKARRRRKKLLKQAKGYYGARSKTYRKAAETLARARMFAYRDRRTKKRMLRRLWVTRINAAARLNDISYSRLLKGLNKASIRLDRKILADMAVNDAEGFKKVVEMAKSALAADSHPLDAATAEARESSGREISSHA